MRSARGWRLLRSRRKRRGRSRGHCMKGFERSRELVFYHRRTIRNSREKAMLDTPVPILPWMSWACMAFLLRMDGPRLFRRMDEDSIWVGGCNSMNGMAIVLSAYSAALVHHGRQPFRTQRIRNGCVQTRDGHRLIDWRAGWFLAGCIAMGRWDAALLGLSYSM